MPETGKDENWLRDLKNSYACSLRTWNALYQCRPSVEKGNIIERSWWNFYDAENPPAFARVVISVDASFKDSENSDYVAVSVWGKTGGNIFLIEMLRERLDFVGTVRAVMEMTKKYPEYSALYIEDKANGPAIISYLRKKIHGVIAVDPQGGKTARVNAVTGIIEAGGVYLPRGGKNVAEFIEECAAFPRGAHDDMVDSMSQALLREYGKKAEIRMVKKSSRQFSFDEKKEKDILGKGERISAF